MRGFKKTGKKIKIQQILAEADYLSAGGEPARLRVSTVRARRGGGEERLKIEPCPR